MSFDFSDKDSESIDDENDLDEEVQNPKNDGPIINMGQSLSTQASMNELANWETNKNNSQKKSLFVNPDKNEIKLNLNNYQNIEYQNLLNCIINKGQIKNSIIISENNNFINKVIKEAIYSNLDKNKKICFIVSEQKKGQYIYELYKDLSGVKANMLQKNKGKKSKNDYQSFRNHVDSNNFFIVLPNILYKLLSIGFVKIYDFGLLIFDDCHLCDSSHPYNIIMQEFYFYYIVMYNKGYILPNILGLTNSPYKDKNIVKNNKKCEELFKNISENLDCQIVVDPAFFENNKNEEENAEFIEVESFMKEKQKVEGINLILMKFFFEDMLNICLDDYLRTKGPTKELNLSNKDEIKKKYLNSVKDKFNSDTFEKYNSIETAERSLHFLSTNSTLFHTFEEIQKHLINIIQNLDLEEIYKLFEDYKNKYEDNLRKQKENEENINKYMIKLYKKLIFIFKVNMRAFKRLLDKNVVYKTDRLTKFVNKLTNIYINNKNSKTFIFVPNRKIANIMYNYLNRNKKDNYFRGKSNYIIGANGKKEENQSLTLATRITPSEINERIKSYNENKINILICTPPAIEYLNKESCNYVIIFSELSNSNSDYEKVKLKAKSCKAKLIILGNEANKIDNSLKIKKDKEITQLKNVFMEGGKIKNPKNFRSKNYIEEKNLKNNIYHYIESTEAKISLKNCMSIFNEINNSCLSKNIKINIKKYIIPYDKEQKFQCVATFQGGGDNPVQFFSSLFNDKQSAEGDCYLKYIIYLQKIKFIDEHFRTNF